MKTQTHTQTEIDERRDRIWGTMGDPIIKFCEACGTTLWPDEYQFCQSCHAEYEKWLEQAERGQENIPYTHQETLARRKEQAE